MLGLDRLAGPLQSILRIVTGLLFLEHGTTKLFTFPPTEMFAQPPATLSLLWFAGVIELVGGAFVALGLFTRPTAFVLSGQMAVAYFLAHAPRSFFPAVNQGDAAILFCFIFLFLAAAGAGPWSIDALLRKKA
jgi:putative oxidoreductase